MNSISWSFQVIVLALSPVMYFFVFGLNVSFLRVWEALFDPNDRSWASSSSSAIGSSSDWSDSSRQRTNWLLVSRKSIKLLRQHLFASLLLQRWQHWYKNGTLGCWLSSSTFWLWLICLLISAPTNIVYRVRFLFGMNMLLAPDSGWCERLFVALSSDLIRPILLIIMLVVMLSEMPPLSFN